MTDQPQATPFDYLLNRMELASQSDTPAEAGYAKHRQAVLDYVAEAQSEIARLRELIIESRKWQAEGEDGTPLGENCWTPRYRDYMLRLIAECAQLEARK